MKSKLTASFHFLFTHRSLFTRNYQIHLLPEMPILLAIIEEKGEKKNRKMKTEHERQAMLTSKGMTVS
jgi:hypothetical protein